MSFLMSCADAAERPAKALTSLATTAKPLPCSPALAASTASLSANKFFTQYIQGGILQNPNYDPKVSQLCYTYYPNRVYYSLYQKERVYADNWFTFLPLNYAEFKSKITSVKNFAKTGMFVTFQDDAPLIYQGVDSLQLKAMLN
jgi:hypothetical protein